MYDDAAKKLHSWARNERIPAHDLATTDAALGGCLEHLFFTGMRTQEARTALYAIAPQLTVKSTDLPRASAAFRGFKLARADALLETTANYYPPKSYLEKWAFTPFPEGQSASSKIGHRDEASLFSRQPCLQLQALLRDWSFR